MGFTIYLLLQISYRPLVCLAKILFKKLVGSRQIYCNNIAHSVEHIANSDLPAMNQAINDDKARKGGAMDFTG